MSASTFWGAAAVSIVIVSWFFYRALAPKSWREWTRAGVVQAFIGTLRCFVAALGDVLIATGAYVVTALAFQRPVWPVRPGWMLPALTWIAVGVIATVAIERRALAGGRWAYGPEMPVVFGTGLLPLLQWLIVPALTLAVVQQLVWRNHFRAWVR